MTKREHFKSTMMEDLKIFIAKRCGLLSHRQLSPHAGARLRMAASLVNHECREKTTKTEQQLSTVIVVVIVVVVIQLKKECTRLCSLLFLFCFCFVVFFFFRTPVTKRQQAGLCFTLRLRTKLLWKKMTFSANYMNRLSSLFLLYIFKRHIEMFSLAASVSQRSLWTALRGISMCLYFF